MDKIMKLMKTLPTDVEKMIWKNVYDGVIEELDKSYDYWLDQEKECYREAGIYGYESPYCTTMVKIERYNVKRFYRFINTRNNQYKNLHVERLNRAILYIKEWLYDDNDIKNHFKRFRINRGLGKYYIDN